MRFAALLALLVVLSGCDAMAPADPLVADAEPWGEMLAAVNAARAAGATCGSERMAPVPAVIWDARLETAAERHSRDMAEHGHFAHTGTDGVDTGERVRRAGYDWRVVGENIARNQRTVAEVVGDWLESPGHCRQLLDPYFLEMGAAEVDGYWTQVFGVPR